MSKVIDKYGPMSLTELEICEEMLNSHGLFAMKLYVELQEVRRGHPPDRCTTSLDLNRTCTLCELFDACGLMTEVENTIAFHLDTKACLKEVRETFSGSSTDLSDKRSQSVAIESTLAKAALYSTMTVGDNLRHHHTKWQTRLQTAVLSTASRLGLDHHGHKTKSLNRTRKKLMSDSKPAAPSISSLQNLSAHEMSDGWRCIILEKCEGGCCPTLDDYATLSSSYGSGVDTIDATNAKRVASVSATTSKVIDPSILKHAHQPPPSLSQDRSSTEVRRVSKVPPRSDATISTTAVHSVPSTTTQPTCLCSSQNLLVAPEVLAAIPPFSEFLIPRHTHPSAGSEYDSTFSTPKPHRKISSLAPEMSATTPISPISETETKANMSMASPPPDPKPGDEEPMDDPRTHRLREQLAKFDVSLRALREWCQACTVDTFTQIDDLEQQHRRMLRRSRNPVPSEDSSRVDGLPRLTDPDRTLRCGDETTQGDLRSSFEAQERLRKNWQLARERQSKTQKRIRVII